MLRNTFILSSIFSAGTLLMVVASLVEMTSVCMNDWVRYDDSCYYFAHHPTERVVWNIAVQACSRNESHLVIVETKREHGFIRDHLETLTPETDEVFWTFGNDIFTENDWNWGETVKPITTTFWGPGEPNDSGGEDCLAYSTYLQFAWNDDRCDSKQYFICEVSDIVSGSIIG